MKKFTVLICFMVAANSAFSQAFIRLGLDTVTGTLTTATKDTTKKFKIDNTLRRYNENSYEVTVGVNPSYIGLADTIPLAVFGAGSGAAGDTAAFSTSAIYGSLYNAGTDTLLITSFQIGLQGTSPSINTTVYFNDSLGVTAGATKLVNAGNTATNIYTGLTVSSLDNRKIPPGNFVWVQTGTVTTKPTYFCLTLIGYKVRI